MAFSKETLNFLYVNRLQNSREWFHENKGDYNKYVVEPFKELVTQMTPEMLKIDSMFITEPRIDRTISRIHRDLRFSKNRSLYRDNVWLIFIRDKKLYNGLPAFYFEISPFEYSYGMGYYQASSESMAIMREMILSGSPIFKNALDAYEKQDIFQIEGDSYKRSKFPDRPENLKKWLDKKSLAFTYTSKDIATVFSDSLADTLIDGFKKLVPVYEFFCGVESRKNAE